LLDELGNHVVCGDGAMGTLLLGQLTESRGANEDKL
jgi:methionine synthase I (cobalamin-dependent)